MATSASSKNASEKTGITRISVKGYKSLRDEQSIEIRPLTILAGANSSGKSSIMQPLLLLKQTLEAPYDPGPLLLNGTHVAFTEVDQILWRGEKGQAKGFSLKIDLGDAYQTHLDYEYSPDSGLNIVRNIINQGDDSYTFTPRMSEKEIRDQIPEEMKAFMESKCFTQITKPKVQWDIIPARFFLCPAIIAQDTIQPAPLPLFSLLECLKHFIHLPALRSDPQRDYRVAAVEHSFAGRFDNYVASVIAKWQTEGNTNAIQGLCEDLKLLGLGWKIEAKKISDVQVELRVGRLPRPVKGSEQDLVSIADVGVGVSQTLPVLVGLRVATPEHLVYIEQPEIHLHPRAQVGMAEVLARAVDRGVRMVIETHSPLLLLALQTAVAKGRLKPELVKLHWFERKSDGATTITSADVDQAGAFGDWPEDFGDVTLDIEKQFLDAAEAKIGTL